MFFKLEFRILDIKIKNRQSLSIVSFKNNILFLKVIANNTQYFIYVLMSNLKLNSNNDCHSQKWIKK